MQKGTVVTKAETREWGWGVDSYVKIARGPFASRREAIDDALDVAVQFGTPGGEWAVVVGPLRRPRRPATPSSSALLRLMSKWLLDYDDDDDGRAFVEDDLGHRIPKIIYSTDPTSMLKTTEVGEAALSKLLDGWARRHVTSDAWWIDSRDNDSGRVLLAVAAGVPGEWYTHKKEDKNVAQYSLQSGRFSAQVWANGRWRLHCSGSVDRDTNDIRGKEGAVVLAKAAVARLMSALDPDLGGDVDDPIPGADWQTES